MKQLSQQAATAKVLREWFKEKGIKARITSESFSMGNAVRVSVDNQPPEVMKEINEKCSFHQYSSYDPYEDYHGNGNTKPGVQQAKYVTATNEMSNDIRQAGWLYMKEHFAGGELLPDDVNAPGTHSMQIFESWATSILHQLLNGSLFDGEDSRKFWAEWLAKNQLEQPIIVPCQSGSFTIEEHTHTKKCFQMFICIMSERVERDEYLAQLEKARLLGGWYSRAWGNTPAGFAFKDRARAEQFTGSTSTETGVFNIPTCKPIVTASNPELRSCFSVKLRDMAAKMQKDIDNKLSDRQTNTPKRLAQARHSQLEGDRLVRTQTVLNGIADLYESKTLPAILLGINTKKAVYDLMGTILEPVQNGYHTYHVCTGKPRETSPVAVALWQLVKGKTDEQKRAEDLKRRIDGLQFSNIPNYFPTPEFIVQKMINFADLEDHLSILEPSAGHGSICKAVNGHKGRKVAIEYNHTLTTILKDSFEDWAVYGGDFLTDINLEALGTFDRILMNPPFERGADIKHINHALKLLKPGGKLVSICAGGQKQLAELQPIASHWEDLPAGSFKEAGTGVNTCLLVIDK